MIKSSPSSEQISGRRPSVSAKKQNPDAKINQIAKVAALSYQKGTSPSKSKKSFGKTNIYPTIKSERRIGRKYFLRKKPLSPIIRQLKNMYDISSEETENRISCDFPKNKEITKNTGAPIMTSGKNT